MMTFKEFLVESLPNDEQNQRSELVVRDPNKNAIQNKRMDDKAEQGDSAAIMKKIRLLKDQMRQNPKLRPQLQAKIEELMAKKGQM